MTVADLTALGANTQEGLQRCMNNETFYLRMVDMGLKDAGFDKFYEAASAGKLKEAFEAAHALKGILSNLALTPILTPVAEVTELLRAGKEMDYSGYVETIKAERDKFTALL